MRSALALALALGGLPAALASQPGSGDVPPGTRVRVSAPSRGISGAVGTLTRAGPDTIAFTLVRRGGGHVALPRSAVTRFELSHDRQSPVLAAGIWGAVGAPAGALAGVLAGVGYSAQLTDGCDAGDTEQECRRESDRTLRRAVSAGAVIGAVVGVVAGATYGVAHRRARWRVADVPLQVGVVLPAGLTVSFAVGRP